jgi:sec-independent protein translocase protein TatA
MIPGPTELILILLIVVLIFGAKRIPEIMGGLGKGIKSFKKAMDTEDTPETSSPPQGTPPPQASKPPQTSAHQDAGVSGGKIEPK